MRRPKRYYSDYEQKETGDLYYDYKKWRIALLSRYPHIEDNIMPYSEGETWACDMKPDSYDVRTW